jgi:hypothetical protein
VIYIYVLAYLFHQVISDMKNRERFMTIINDIVEGGKYRLCSFSVLHMDFHSLPGINSSEVIENIKFFFRY